jgi:hypothetical protein
MIGLLGIAWAACAVALGAEGWSLWWIAPLAASGVGLYFLLRPEVLLMHTQRGQWITALPGYLAAYAVMAWLLFGAGHLIGSIL